MLWESHVLALPRFIHLLLHIAGVSIKAWNICLKDPGLEENDEVAKIILSAPKNVVLGQKNELTVRIIDSMAGKTDRVEYT